MEDAGSFEVACALQGQGRFDEARKVYRQILKAHPRHFEAQCQLAILAYQQGRTADALKENERALRLNPNVAGLHNNQGTFLLELARYPEAAASFARAVKLDPGDAQARNNLGGALYKNGRLDAALGHVEAALAMAPEYAKAHSDRGTILIALGRADEAIEACERAIALAPQAWEPHENRGIALLHAHRLEEALASFGTVIALNPSLAGAHGNRGTTLDLLGRFAQAEESYRAAVALDPNTPLARGARLHLRMKECSWSGFEEEAKAVMAAIGKGVLASPPFPVLALPSLPAQQRKAAALYTKLWPAHGLREFPPRAPGGKIRLVYVSSDLFNHAVGQAVAPVFEAHDRARFEVWGVSITPPKLDDVHQRLRGAMDGYIDVSALSDDAAATRIADLGADIAIDLNGYTMNARPGIFARRAAPVQVSWLGYPGTTASAAIDYLVADLVAVPLDHERHYTEKVIRLPGSLFPASTAREIPGRPMTRAEAGLPDGAIVFCAFNNAYKITPDVFDAWMRLLKAAEGSVLWLSARGAAAQENLAAEAEARGISAGRLIFAPSLPLPEHLARHRLADIFLDTFYYGAHSTAADALVAGLPVLTRLGAAFAGRVAASLLTTLGLTELIAADTAAYESKALELVRNPSALADMKDRLSNALSAFDTARFTRGLEEAYERIWRNSRDR